MGGRGRDLCVTFVGASNAYKKEKMDFNAYKKVKLD